MKRIHRIGCLLFSISFFIYSVSPLSAIYQQKQAFGQPTSVYNGIRLFVVELMLSPLTQENEDDETSSRFLLRKKRATLSPDKLKISKKQLKNDAVASSGIISSAASRPLILTLDNEPKLQTGSHHPHSGLSPPLA